MTDTVATTSAPVVGKLSTLDRFLPVWIGVAMAAGLLLGRWVPGMNAALDGVQIDGISLPIALGLLIMMYPVLAKVRYDRLDAVTGDRKLLLSSLFLNWVFGPALMFALAWLMLQGVKAAVSYPAGWLADRLGASRLVMAGWGLYALSYVALSRVHGVEGTLIVMAVYGLYHALAEGVDFDY